jgi:hypothetical protein
MRMLLLMTAAIAITALSAPAHAAPVPKGKFVVSLGKCIHLANARGWTRYREPGRYRFILNCRRGKIG